MTGPTTTMHLYLKAMNAAPVKHRALAKKLVAMRLKQAREVLANAETIPYIRAAKIDTETGTISLRLQALPAHLAALVVSVLGADDGGYAAAFSEPPKRPRR